MTHQLHHNSEIKFVFWVFWPVIGCTAQTYKTLNIYPRRSSNYWGLRKDESHPSVTEVTVLKIPLAFAVSVLKPDTTAMVSLTEKQFVN